jgi:hypothetical protein
VKILVIAFFVVSFANSHNLAPQRTFAKDSSKEISFVGRWHVKFTLVGGSEKNLVLTSHEKGEGSFEMLDTGPNNDRVLPLIPTTWSQKVEFVSISGEVELPIGTCCRENGTLIFKGKLLSQNSYSGKLIFVTNTDEEESPYKYRSTIGTFTATRIVPR